MIKSRSLQDVIEQNISLGKKSPSGWYSVKCPVCNDHSARAGFNMDGTHVGYSDFNCGAKFKYTEGSGKLSKSARDILRAFNISDQEINSAISSCFFNEQKNTQIKNREYSLSTPSIDLPPGSVLLTQKNSTEYSSKLIKYLQDRKIDINSSTFYYSTDPKFLNRVIIPCVRDKKIIYWQARSIVPNEKPRYLSSTQRSEAILWGYNNLSGDGPLFVTEGIFDAMPLNGIALLGSRLNKAQIAVLNSTPRQKVFVVDKGDAQDNGKKLGMEALLNSYSITTSPTGTKDVNDSIQKYGVLYTVHSLIQRINKNNTIKKDGMDVQAMLELQIQSAFKKDLL